MSAVAVEADVGGRFDEPLIASLVTGATVKSAAEHAGCSYATARRRLDDPAFRLRLIEVKNDHLARLLTTIVHGQIRAAYRLIAVVNDDSTPPVGVVAGGRDAARLRRREARRARVGGGGVSNPSRFHLPEGGAPAELDEGSDRLDEMIDRMRLALEFGMLVVDLPSPGEPPSGGLPPELVDVAVAELRKAGWTCTPPDHG